MATLFSDNFDRADGVIGAPWTYPAGDTYSVVSNRAQQTAGAVDRAARINAGATDMRVTATVTNGGSHWWALCAGRGSTSAWDTGWGVSLQGNTNGGIYLFHAGANLWEGGVGSYVEGATYSLEYERLTATTARARVYRDGVLLQTVASFTSTDYSTYAAISSGGAGGARFDNFLVEDLATGLVANAGADQSATLGATVTLHASASGGTSPYNYTWSQISGATVALSDTSAAEPTFVPAASGSYTFRVTVTDAASGSATDDVTVTITAAATPPVISTATLGAMNRGVPYSLTLSASGTTPITWSATAGALPSGLTLSGATISGTPTVSGSGSVTIRATNEAGNDEQPFAWTVAEPGVIEYDDPGLTYSVCNWADTGSAMEVADHGGWIEVVIRNTTRISITGSGAMEWTIDGGLLQGQVVLGSAVLIADALSTEAHHLRLYSRTRVTFQSLSVDSAASVDTPRRPARRLLAFGDSITRGDYNGHTSYVPAMAHALGADHGIVAQNSRCFNDSQAGEPFTFRTGWDRVDPINLSRAIDWSEPPDVVTIMLGAAGGLVAADVTGPIMTLLATLPEARVVVLRHIPTEPTRVAQADQVESIVQGMSHPRLHYVDTRNWLTEYDTITNDDVHPTAGAAALIGTRLGEAIRQLIYEPTVTFVPAASWPPAADPDPLHFYARVT